jgi:hypothetical protein
VKLWDRYSGARGNPYVAGLLTALYARQSLWFETVHPFEHEMKQFLKARKLQPVGQKYCYNENQWRGAAHQNITFLLQQLFVGKLVWDLGDFMLRRWNTGADHRSTR